MGDLSTTPKETGSRVVLVTGAARGIGLSIARAFRDNGDAVVATDVAALPADEGFHACRLDVTSEAEVEATFAKVEAELGPVEVLVNNAGVMSRTAVSDTPVDEWDRVISTNLKSVFLCSRRALPAMAQAGAGVIINIGSIWATHAWPERAAYAASKAAVEQFTRCLALEVAPLGIRVNAISPGIMATSMTERVVDDPLFKASFMPRVALGTVGVPAEHLAGIAVFLASPAAGYMAGEVVEAHGGYY